MKVFRSPDSESVPTHFAREKGAALMAILWVITILSLLVFSATQLLFVEVEADANANSLFRAEQLSDRGIAIGSHPEIERGDPLLSEEFNDEESYRTRISSEGDRLNLNRLLENAVADRIVLENLFISWGLRSDQAVDVVDNLIDWVDADDLPTNVGAERSFYFERGRINHPFNRKFNALEEVELVHQFNLVVAANPLWKDSFTLLSAGPLDLNEAPANLIAAACECGEAAAENFVKIRDGIDQLPGTEDDLRYSAIEQALAELGVPEPLLETISPRVAIEDPSRRIISVGRFGSIAVERTITVQYTGAVGTVMQWTTRRIE